MSNLDLAVQEYDPEMDSVDMLREKIPDWRINSLARHSATPSITAHDHDV